MEKTVSPRFRQYFASAHACKLALRLRTVGSLGGYCRTCPAPRIRGPRPLFAVPAAGFVASSSMATLARCFDQQLTGGGAPSRQHISLTATIHPMVRSIGLKGPLAAHSSSSRNPPAHSDIASHDDKVAQVEHALREMLEKKAVEAKEYRERHFISENLGGVEILHLRYRDSPIEDSLTYVQWEAFKTQLREWAEDDGSFYVDWQGRDVDLRLEGALDELRLQITEIQNVPRGQRTDLICRYWMALKEEARREKLFMEYLVEEFNHWEWLVEELDEERMGWPILYELSPVLLDFLKGNYPWATERSLGRGMLLHWSRIPYQHLLEPLPRAVKDQIRMEINNAYRAVDSAILHRGYPLKRSQMLSTIGLVDGLPACQVAE